jgi:CheY-like chemotaxis protein
MAESLWRRVLFPGSYPRCGAPTEPVLPSVLAITASAGDHDFYTAMGYTGPGGQREWDIAIAQTVPEALGLLTSRAFPVVLCDRDLPGWDWRDALTRIVECSPGICFLLTSRVSDEFLWREVVMLGGYDVVPRPLIERVVTQTLQRAMYDWNRKTELRRPGVTPKT